MCFLHTHLFIQLLSCSLRSWGGFFRKHFLHIDRVWTSLMAAVSPDLSRMEAKARHSIAQCPVFWQKSQSFTFLSLPLCLSSGITFCILSLLPSLPPLSAVEPAGARRSAAC